MIGAGLAIASGLASLYGSMKSAQANRAIDDQLRRRQSELDTWYNKEYNQNYLDTEEAQSTVALLRQQMAEQMKKYDQNSAIKGASDEARIAQADQLQKRMGQNVTQLAGYGTRYKDMIRREYQGLNANLDQLQAQNLQNKNQQWMNFMGNATNAGMGFAEAGANGAFDNWDNKLTSMFKNRNNKSWTKTYGPTFSI